MKYLKSINEVGSYIGHMTSSEKVKDIFTPFINWDLIEDVKDMSLEYIDLDMTLNLSVKQNDVWIYAVLFNHNMNDVTWFNVNMYNITPIQSGGDLKYQLELCTNLFDTKVYDLELINRASEAYPNENIT